MGESNGDWLRVRGIGRERFAGYLADYLGTLGYSVERSETTEPAESHLSGRLDRMNPAVPPAANALAFRFYPTSGGAAVVWEMPTVVPTADRSRMDRLMREIQAHLERVVHSESHATAKVVRPVESRLPWAEPSPPGVPS
jgi:hypothetical protein